MTEKKTLTKIIRKGSVPEITPEQKIKAGIIETPKKQKIPEPIKKEETKKEIEKIPQNKKIEEKKDDKKDKKKQIKKIKKTKVEVNGKSLPISTKYAISICKFIKNKKIENALKDLQEVAAHKKAVPMRGEIPHRKGKIMSGRFPKNASEHFIVLLKSLLSNANNHDVEEPIIVKAIANFAPRPFGRFGKVKRKRTHIRIVAKNKKFIKKK